MSCALFLLFLLGFDPLISATWLGLRLSQIPGVCSGTILGGCWSLSTLVTLAPPPSDGMPVWGQSWWTSSPLPRPCQLSKHVIDAREGVLLFLQLEIYCAFCSRHKGIRHHLVWRHVQRTNNKHWNDWKMRTTLLYYQPTKDVLLLLWTRLTTLTKWTHLLTTNKLTKTSNATRRQHFNVNLTAKYLRLRRLTLLTLNATIDWGAQYLNHRNFTDYRNYTNLLYRCDL